MTNDPIIKTETTGYLTLGNLDPERATFLTAQIRDLNLAGLYGSSPVHHRVDIGENGTYSHQITINTRTEADTALALRVLAARWDGPSTEEPGEEDFETLINALANETATEAELRKTKAALAEVEAKLSTATGWRSNLSALGNLATIIVCLFVMWVGIVAVFRLVGQVLA